MVPCLFGGAILKSCRTSALDGLEIDVSCSKKRSAFSGRGTFVMAALSSGDRLAAISERIASKELK